MEIVVRHKRSECLVDYYEDDFIEIIDLVDDVDYSSLSPEEYVKVWDEKIHKEIFMNLICIQRLKLNKCLRTYIYALKQVDRTKATSLLKDKILEHIHLIHICYYSEKCIRIVDTYEFLKNMVEIITFYCNLELKCAKEFKRITDDDAVVKEKFSEATKNICTVLSLYLMKNRKHIYDVLFNMKFKSYKKICADVCWYYLQYLPETDISKEGFCRNYLLVEKIKTVVSKEEYTLIMKIMEDRYSKLGASFQKGPILVLQVDDSEDEKDAIDDYDLQIAESRNIFKKRQNIVTSVSSETPSGSKIIEINDDPVEVIDLDDENISDNDVEAEQSISKDESCTNDIVDLSSKGVIETQSEVVREVAEPQSNHSKNDIASQQNAVVTLTSSEEICTMGTSEQSTYTEDHSVLPRKAMENEDLDAADIQHEETSAVICIEDSLNNLQINEDHNNEIVANDKLDEKQLQNSGCIIEDSLVENHNLHLPCDHPVSDDKIEKSNEIEDSLKAGTSLPLKKREVPLADKENLNDVKEEISYPATQ